MENPSGGESVLETAKAELERLARELPSAPDGPGKERIRNRIAGLAALAACGAGPDGLPFRDLAGVPCPLGWAKARLVLEGLPPGGLLRLRIGDGQPAENIPSRLAAERFELLERCKNDDGTWFLLVRKPRNNVG